MSETYDVSGRIATTTFREPRPGPWKINMTKINTDRAASREKQRARNTNTALAEIAQEITTTTDKRDNCGGDLVPKLSLDELASDIRDAFLTCVRAREDWTKATLKLAERLYEARSHFPSNQDFSDWLAREGFGKDVLNHQDRAALINIGEHIDVARDIIEKTDRRSWRLVWDREIKNVVLQEEVGVGPSYQSGNTAEAEPENKEIANTQDDDADDVADVAPNEEEDDPDGKLSCGFALLDIVGGRHRLAKLVDDGHPIGFTISGFIIETDNDDGVGIQFAAEVTDAEFDDPIKPPRGRPAKQAKTDGEH
jgi:hypothetical protein